MTTDTGWRRSPWRRIGLVGRLGAPLVCAGCLFALRAEERLRQTTDAYEAAMKSASESLVLLARSANDLVVVLRGAPASVTQAMAAQDNIRAAMTNISELSASLDRAVGVVVFGLPFPAGLVLGRFLGAPRQS